MQDIVVWHESLGRSADEIVARYPQLTLADVHAALTYYFDNAEEIRRHLNEDKRFAEEMRARIPSKVAAKLAEKDGSGDAVSSG